MFTLSFGGSCSVSNFVLRFRLMIFLSQVVDWSNRNSSTAKIVCTSACFVGQATTLPSNQYKRRSRYSFLIAFGIRHLTRHSVLTYFLTFGSHTQLSSFAVSLDFALRVRLVIFFNQVVDSLHLHVCQSTTRIYAKR